MKLLMESWRNFLNEGIGQIYPSDLGDKVAEGIREETQKIVAKEKMEDEPYDDEWASAERENVRNSFAVGLLEQTVSVLRKKGPISAQPGWYVTQHGVGTRMWGSVVGGPFPSEQEATSWIQSRAEPHSENGV